MEPLSQIVWNKFAKEVPEVPLTKDDEMIQTLGPDSPHEPFSMRGPCLAKPGGPAMSPRAGSL
jgi:hypothetical protein